MREEGEREEGQEGKMRRVKHEEQEEHEVEGDMMGEGGKDLTVNLHVSDSSHCNICLLVTRERERERESLHMYIKMSHISTAL